MRRGIQLILTGVMIMLFATPNLTAAAKNSTDLIPLPAPQRDGGMPLMEALSKRQSVREYSTKAIPDPVLSNLLWAVWGYNREDQKKRTAPSANNKQEFSLYLAKSDGLFLYDAEAHALRKISDQDIRKETGKQPFVAQAPLNLIMVADTKLQSSLTSSYANAGFISENIYLVCASEGLGTVVRGWFDAGHLHTIMGLGPDQQIILCQTVGYPK